MIINKFDLSNVTCYSQVLNVPCDCAAMLVVRVGCPVYISIIYKQMTLVTFKYDAVISL